MTALPDRLGPRAASDCLAGGGEMGERMRAHDWTGTPLGVPEAWPQSLRSAVSICLNSRFPIAIYWGPELALLYNDAWSPIPGEKHPWALGRAGREVWPEIWAEIGPLFQEVQRAGEGVWQQDQLLPMHRHGYTEECYFNFTFSPIHGEDGGVAGVFNAVVETTFHVIEKRRARILRELAERTAGAKSAPEACILAAEVLGASAADVPFCLFYLREEVSSRLRLAAAAGTLLPERARPGSIDPADPASPWPMVTALGSARSEVIDRPGERFGVELPSVAWPEPVESAVIAPLAGIQGNEPLGVLITGVSPRLALDEAYRTFIERIGMQVAISIGNAQAYEAERQRAEALAEIDRAKTAFFSNVSHEFRTPLTLILGPLEDALAEDGGLHSAHRERLEVAHRNSLRLLKLVNTLLDFSRIEAGRLQASYEPVDLAAFTAELASVFRSAVERTGLRLLVHCPPLDEPVYIDREMWEKIVLNLLSNAFKFTFEGEIEVSLRRAGEAAELTVRDTGTGIPAEELPRLFERFHRVQGARGRTFEGSGIGLALVQELAKLHGGTVRVESEVDRGSTFTVTVPLGTAHLPADRLGAARALASTSLRGEAYLQEALRWLPEDGPEFPLPDSGLKIQAMPEAHPKLETGSSSPARILVADDNADMREYVRRLLSEEYEVVAVNDGAAALRAVREQSFDLVLSDVMMPHLDGFELLGELRSDESTKTLPVILLSARAGEEAKLEGLTAGADDYLVKPFSTRELLTRVESHLKLQRVRREAQEALRASEEKFSTAFGRSPLALTITSVDDGRLVEVNDGFVELSGYTREEALGRTPEELGLWTEPEVRAERFARLLAGERLPNIEARFRIKNGEELTGVIGSALVEINSRKCVLSSVTDITARKRAEEGLREAHTLLRAAMDAGKLGAWEWDIKADKITWTDRVHELHGLKPGTFGGTVEDFAKLVHPEDLPAVQGAIEQALAGRAPYELEFRTIRPDGETRWISTRAEVFTDSAGAPVRMIGIVQDVTPRKRSEQRLTEQARLLDLSNDTIFVRDREDRITFWNRGAEETYGFTRAEALGKVTHDLLQTAFPESLARIDEKLRRDGYWSGELVHTRKDGSKIVVMSRWALDHDAQGNPASILETNNDITERKQAEEALREADRRKDEFLAMLAHELRNPLAPIRNAAQVLKLVGHQADAHQQWAREVIERQTQHLTRLVDDLLDVSRITRGKVTLAHEPLDLSAIIHRAVETSRPLIDARHHQLTVVLPPEPVRLEGDLTRLVQVVGNLLNNAAKYTNEGGHIWLAAGGEGAEAVIRVRDDGVGLPADLLPHVFDLFTQADRSLDRSQGGLGIGLTLVRQLVELHGGQVEARSDGPGLGSEFIVRLPLAASVAAADTKGTVGEGARLAPRALKILVVEDNTDSAEMLTFMLELGGHQVRIARDGTSALDAARAFQPQVVLCDIGLPGMNGYEVAQRLRAQPALQQTRLIALTGYGQEEDRRRAHTAGFDYHLVKPVEPDALGALLESLRGE